MERISFIIEETGEQVSCLLNPETVLVTRSAGIRSQHGISGLGYLDYPLVYTGGGTTRLRLDLLFDVTLVEESTGTRPDDVRTLTRPLWKLSEHRRGGDVPERPSVARFVWGRSWNMPGVVTAIAERFDRFTAVGVPLRSWLRLSFARTATAEEPEPLPENTPPQTPQLDLTAAPVSRLETPSSSALAERYEVLPGQLGNLSLSAFGTPFLWKELMDYNGVDDPLHPSGPLDIPPQRGL
jgi:hypothetical protein